MIKIFKKKGSRRVHEDGIKTELPSSDISFGGSVGNKPAQREINISIIPIEEEPKQPTEARIRVCANPEGNGHFER